MMRADESGGTAMDRRLIAPAVLLLLSLLPGCDRPATQEGAMPAEESSMPETPFTAEQIRDAMPVGLILEIRRAAGGQESRQRWTVVAADAEGVEIEYTPLDAAREPAGEPEVARSAWVELRDHARFPPEHTTRHEAVRDTPLGKLDGWVYTVADPDGGTVTEFFFARSLPGAPVVMRATRGEEVVAEMAQLSRNKP
jgi:hypothetical protein